MKFSLLDIVTGLDTAAISDEDKIEAIKYLIDSLDRRDSVKKIKEYAVREWEAEKS
jgi:hypothetical protein